MVRERLHEAWRQPSAEEAGDAEVEISIKMDGTGRVTGRDMVRSSGNPVLDASAMAAVRAVDRIWGLPASFLARHSEVTVSFKVE